MKPAFLLLTVLVAAAACRHKDSFPTELQTRQLKGPVKSVRYCSYRAVTDSVTGTVTADTALISGCFLIEFDKQGFSTKKILFANPLTGVPQSLTKPFYVNGRRAGDSTFNTDGVLKEVEKINWIDKHTLQSKTYNKEGRLVSDYTATVNDSMQIIFSVATSGDTAFRAYTTFEYRNNNRMKISRTKYTGRPQQNSETFYEQFDFDSYGNPRKLISGINSPEHKALRITITTYEYY